MQEVAIKLLEKGNGEELPRFFSISWSLWIRRNNMVYKEGLQEIVTEVFEMGVSAANSYHSLLTECATKPKVLKWDPPLVDFLKLNVNGAIIFYVKKVEIDFIV